MYMKKLLIKNMIALVAILSLGSCEKKLDLFPYSSIELSQSFKTMNDALAWNNGLYNDFRARQQGALIINCDVQADQLNATLGYGNRFGFPHKWGTSFQADDGAFSGAWQTYYSALRNVNSTIEGYAKIKPSTAAQAASLKRYLGETYLARAYYYHELVLRFSKAYDKSTASSDLGVPLVLEYDINARPARATVQKVYDQILSDIATSKQNLEGINGSPGANRFNLDVALALEARVRLDMEDWTGASNTAGLLVASGRYTLLNTRTGLNNMWTNDLSTEVIFNSAVIKQTEQANTNGNYLNFSGANSLFSPDFIPTQEFINLYDASDFRRSVYFADLPCIIQGTRKTLTCVNKYPGNPTLFTAANTNYQHAPKAFRFAEQYLIRAEALAKLGGNDGNALITLNLLRTARGLTPLAGLTGAALMTEIRNERTRELAFEGRRLFDLKRWKLGFSRGTSQDLSILVTAPAEDFHAKVVTASNPQFIWAVPTYEINANTNLVQNPGW